MPSLVIAEHENGALKTAALNPVTAAAAIDPEVHVLVAGAECAAAADAAAKVAGVAKVLLGDMANLGLVIVHKTATGGANKAHLMLMERVLSGLRRL